jgi:lipoprotein NlpD
MMPMMFNIARLARCAALIVGALALAACSSPNRRAPVEERGAAPRPPVIAAAPSGAASAPEGPRVPPPGLENAGKPGYYTVKTGDTLIRIGLDSGQNWRDIARWNGMDNPNVIEIGQVLRVVPPGVDPNAQSTRAVVAGKVESRPLDAKPGATPASGAASGASAAPAVAAREGDDNLAWNWPASAPIAVPFDGSRNKGVQFRGKAGDAVLAAADGKVIYAGSGLRGYGNFVIIQHNANFLSVYAHNQALLVKEDQPVRRGQKIAEMGATEADQVQLHFEIRRQGKAVDPAVMLPPR